MCGRVFVYLLTFLGKKLRVHCSSSWNPWFFFPLSKFSKLFNAFEIIFNILIPTSAVVPISAAAVDLYNVIVAYLRWYDDVAVMFLMFILSRKNLKFFELWWCTFIFVYVDARIDSKILIDWSISFSVYLGHYCFLMFLCEIDKPVGIIDGCLWSILQSYSYSCRCGLIVCMSMNGCMKFFLFISLNQAACAIRSSCLLFNAFYTAASSGSLFTSKN